MTGKETKKSSNSGAEGDGTSQAKQGQGKGIKSRLTDAQKEMLASKSRGGAAITKRRPQPQAHARQRQAGPDGKESPLVALQTSHGGRPTIVGHFISQLISTRIGA